MQRPQEKERPNRPKPRRTVGELLTAGLILLWGLANLLDALITFPEGLATFPLPLLLTNLLILLQAVLCIVSGLCVFLRQRLFAKYGLIVVTLCFWGLVAVNVWLLLREGQSDDWQLVRSAVFVIVATLLSFLGRWLGQQEESKG